MIEKYILVEFKNQKFISLFSEDGDEYKEERIVTDLSVYNLLTLKTFIVDDIENTEWYIKDYSFLPLHICRQVYLYYKVLFLNSFKFLLDLFFNYSNFI